MDIYFELKPSTHEFKCAMCGKRLAKGEMVLTAEQQMFPGIKKGRACMGCLLKGIHTKLKTNSTGDHGQHW